MKATTAAFLDALAIDFEQHGAQAIATVRTSDPAGYVRVVASLMPKGVEVTRPLDGVTDDELIAAVATLRGCEG